MCFFCRTNLSYVARTIMSPRPHCTWRRRLDDVLAYVSTFDSLASLSWVSRLTTGDATLKKKKVSSALLSPSLGTTCYRFVWGPSNGASFHCLRIACVHLTCVALALISGQQQPPIRVSNQFSCCRSSKRSFFFPRQLRQTKVSLRNRHITHAKASRRVENAAPGDGRLVMA